MYTTKAPVRDRLLEGALRCLREQGYATTTARDVAAASGANLRSIGYHFGSTKQLLLTAISLNFRRWLEPLIATTADEGRDPADRVRLGMTQFAAALPDNAPVLRAWLEAVSLGGHEAELGAALASGQAEFRARLERTLAEAGVEDPGEGAAAIITVCDGLIVRFLLHGEVAAPERVATAAARALE